MFASDYFSEDYLLVVDESHVSLPQVRAMYTGTEKEERLAEHGSVCPRWKTVHSAFDEFNEEGTSLYVSATPRLQLEQSGALWWSRLFARRVLLDPEISVRPIKIKVDDLV